MVIQCTPQRLNTPEKVEQMAVKETYGAVGRIIRLFTRPQPVRLLETHFFYYPYYTAGAKSELPQPGGRRMTEFFFAVADSLDGHVSKMKNLPVLEEKEADPGLVAKAAVSLEDAGDIICKELKKQVMTKFGREPEITLKEIQKIYKPFYACKCARGEKEFYRVLDAEMLERNYFLDLKFPKLAFEE